MIIDTNSRATPHLACLRQNGVDTIIRYYCRRTSQSEKRLTPDEAAAIIRAGIKLAVVYQGAGNSAASFSQTNGTQDASHARDYASHQIGQPRGSAIYFAVDYDATAGDVRSSIIPYFTAVRQAFATASGEPEYQIGVYGSGAVCQALLDARLVSLTWVSQSRGFRGTADFVASGRWNLKQGRESNLCGMSIDSNEANPRLPQFGAFSEIAGVGRAPEIALGYGAPVPLTIADLRFVQERLHRLNYPTGDIDGVYGSLTRGALLAFQADNRLPLTGVADAATVAALNVAAPRPLDPTRVGATADDLRKLGSQTIRQADNTKRVGFLSSILGALGIGNSAMVQMTTPAASAPATTIGRPDTLQPALTRFLAELQSFLAPTQPAQPGQQQGDIKHLTDALKQLESLNLQSAITPDNVEVLRQIKGLIPPEALQKVPELNKALQALDTVRQVKPQLQTIFDVLPTFFSDGNTLNLIAKGAAAVAGSTIPGFGGALVALGIGVAANFLGNRMIRSGVQEFRTGANKGI
jgi:hypothetical protein